jgi:3'-phosphoadenosine 5'-phosphosulfate sulfotransferase
MYQNGRIADFALLLGHLWRCTRCREALLLQPELYWVGYKLDQHQRECIKKLNDESFQTVMRLADLSGLSMGELYEAIDHPRARLRHLDGHRYDFRTQRS